MTERAPQKPDWFEQWIGREVVVDVRSLYVYLGVLRGADDRYLMLEDADAHDLRDTTTNRERYVLEARRHGIRRNRKRVLLRWDEVVGLSLLEEVVEE